MNFTGEQFVPGIQKQRLVEEHEARYAYAERITDGKRVLDIACGTGYGTAELAKSATSAVGVDISEESIAYANANYQAPNLEYIHASATDDIFASSSFDLICSFETIEHLTEKERLAYLQNLKKWLKPDGTILFSTPNRTIVSPFSAKPLNQYHIQEFTLQHLKKEIEPYFSIRQILGQRRINKFLTLYPIRKAVHLTQKILRHNFHIYDLADGPEITAFDKRIIEPRILFFVCQQHAMVDTGFGNNCPYCRAKGLRFCTGTDRKEKFVIGAFEYYRCSQCFSLFQNPMPEMNQALKFYPQENYKQYNKVSYPRHDWSILGDIDGVGDILDVGCGGGSSLADFLTKYPNWRAFGIDFSAKALECAASLLPAGTRLFQGEATAELSRFETNSFDVVLAQDFIEHVADPSMIFKELARVLKPNGKLFLTFPNGNSLTMRYFKSSAYHLEAPRHLTVPSTNGLRALSEDNRLKIQTLEGELVGAMLLKSLPWPFIKTWATKLRLFQMGMLLTKPFRHKYLDLFSMVKIVLVK
jgi:2-polyprenyl-3-methyl-5-hydroxy-6-metoxy-1,4-benzoquinol methylase